MDIFEPQGDFQHCSMCDQQRLRSSYAFVQSDQNLCLLLKYSTTVKLLTEYNFEFISLKGGCTSSSESTFVKIPHCWKSHVTAHYYGYFMLSQSPVDQFSL